MFLLHRPRHTEKAFKLHQKRQYTFDVDKKANKVELKKEIEETYHVLVTHLNTAQYSGKPITRHTPKGSIQGRRSNYKKAIATLKEGDFIDINKDSA